ncbi:MerR family transcriptional regulator [Micromonospora sp. DT201]|uniref:MerR family transcriptional regulator n=1 Tax=Micromonospora sp. DT201 TaxID=3393442 RepID=UPI003CECDBBE
MLSQIWTSRTDSRPSSNEKRGLIAGRRLTNGYRDFPPDAVTWLRHVRTAQRLGFSLAEIAQHGEQLRDATDDGPALSALLEEKIRLNEPRHDPCRKVPEPRV